MTRKTLITIHLYLAAFFAPMVFLVAISGGLYLLDIKGGVARETVVGPVASSFDPKSETLKQDVDAVLAEAGIEFDYEYLRAGSSSVVTRPTSKRHYVFSVADGQLSVVRQDPTFQKRMIELHKGHGPQWFKTFQKVFALGLFVIVFSGLWLGLTSPPMKRKTLITSVSGLAVFLALMLL
jgi:uncharacterized iron-regulated membrane protein